MDMRSKTSDCGIGPLEYKIGMRRTSVDMTDSVFFFSPVDKIRLHKMDRIYLSNKRLFAITKKIIRKTKFTVILPYSHLDVFKVMI